MRRLPSVLLLALSGCFFAPLGEGWDRLDTDAKDERVLQIAEDLYEGILRGVLGQVEIAQQRPGVTHSHVLELPDKGREGRRIALASGQDEVGRPSGGCLVWRRIGWSHSSVPELM